MGMYSTWATYGERYKVGNNVISNKFLIEEKKFIIGISFILGMRQFGMMLVTPFISIYGNTLKGNTPALIGLALGIYGLTQGCFQIPYGFLSDKIGRKPVILLGIILQIAGFTVAFYAKSVVIFIFARALQGSGAINSVALSWTGDSIDRNKINKCMGIISTVSSVAIEVSLIGGSFMQKVLTIPQIFLFCAFISVLSWFYILLVLKEDRKLNLKSEDIKQEENKYPIKVVLLNKHLNRLYVTGFISNFMLMAMFYILPQVSDKVYGSGGMWKVFVPAIVLVFFVVKIVNKYNDKGKEALIQVIIFVGFIVSVPCLFASNWFMVSAGVIIFFTGVMCQYTLITAGINTIADERYRGSINGICNAMQFIGSFMGGTLTGIFWGMGLHFSMEMLMTVCIIGAMISGTGIKEKINKLN